MTRAFGNGFLVSTFPHKCLAQCFENADIWLPKASLCPVPVWMPTGLCKLSTVGIVFCLREGVAFTDLEHSLALVAEAYLWFLPTGAPYSLACPPSHWPAHAHIANHACSSFCPIPLPPVTSLSTQWHCQSVLTSLMVKVPHLGR